jgi:hypothetical protein
MSEIDGEIADLKALPASMRVVLILASALTAFSAVTAFILVFASGYKLDPGLATFTGAIIGLTVVGWQTNRGFKNLVRSQANQATLDRQARIHQAELDREAKEADQTREHEILLQGLWAEIISLDAELREDLFNVRMFAEMHKSYRKRGIANTVKGISFKSHNAPYYKANIQKIGLLGPSLGADVIKVLSRADGSSHLYAQDTILSNDTMITMYDGNADSLMDWRDELAHVAKRINALVHNHPDPGSLAATSKQRGEALKVVKEELKNP